MAIGILMKIPKSAYQKARKKVAASQKLWRSHNRNPKKRKKRGMSLPAGTKDAATNRDRAVIEVYEFQNRPAAKPFMGYLKGNKITNFTGLRLCTVTKRTEARSGFVDVTGRRSKRVSVTAACIDGRKYVGTSPGDGMYARMRPKTGKR